MGSSGSSSGGDSNTTNNIRYAPYIETKHADFLSTVATYRALLLNDSPFATFNPYNIDTLFFGAGVAITSFASLYDTFELVLSNYDLDTSYDEIFRKTINSAEVHNLIAQEGIDLSDDIEENALPRILTGARDINSVNSDTFIIARTLLETNRVKALSSFSAKIKSTLIPVVIERWKTQLEWNKQIFHSYTELSKLYLSAKMDNTTQSYEMLVKNKLWPFTILDHERAALGALQGATNSSGTISGEGPSSGQKVLGGAMSGAAAGTMIGGPGIGTAIGGVLGGLAGLL